MTSHPSRKILLVIATLGAGGAERVMTLLAGEWARRGNAVTLVTLSDAEHDHYAVPAGVKRTGLDVLGASRSRWQAAVKNFTRFSKLRQVVQDERPDAVISFMDATNVLTLLATRGLRVPVIVSERIDPRHYPISPGWARLRKKMYPKATAVVVQTSAVAEWAREFVPAEKVHVIANPVSLPNHSDTDVPAWLPQKSFIVAIGRLDPQKGFDLLLHAYSKLNEAPPLVILGEGPERSSLEQTARELGVADRVIMPGRIANPWPVLKRATLFVLSSRFEGFPNALLEAMSAGLPVVSFDCPSGPTDIIIHEKNGLLVAAENVEQLKQAIQHLLDNEILRHQLGVAAQEIAQQHSISKITDEWEDVLPAAEP